MFFSFIIPLYNRPDEIVELLDSLCLQTYTKFEVLVIEDGSKDKAKKEVDSFSDRLDVKYYFKENGGQGFARNHGFERANGDYFIILDSDVIMPPHYLQTVYEEVTERKLDIYGGPDAAHPSFTPVQKAINYSMTSFFTTGGIRGKKGSVEKFKPRSFNMGLSRAVYEKVGGFKITRLGEDIEFSMRIIHAGFKSGLIENAYVYHKRRTDFGRFFRQIQFFGRSRINISTFYPDGLKLVHFFPAFFTLSFLGALLLILISLLLKFSFWWIFMLPFILYSLILFVDASVKNKSLKIGVLGTYSTYLQFFGYTKGFLTDLVKIKIMGVKDKTMEYPD